MKRLLFLLRCAGSLLESRTRLSNHSPASRRRKGMSFNDTVNRSETSFLCEVLEKTSRKEVLRLMPRSHRSCSQSFRNGDTHDDKNNHESERQSTWPLNHPPSVNLFHATTGALTQRKQHSVKTGTCFAPQALEMRLDMRSVDVDYWIKSKPSLH